MSQLKLSVHFLILVVYGWFYYWISLSHEAQMEVRLEGPSRREGLAQIQEDGKWMSVCITTQSGNETSAVICTQLKYPNVLTHNLVATNSTKIVGIECKRGDCNRSYTPLKDCKLLQIVCEPAFHFISQTPAAGLLEYYSPTYAWKYVGWAQGFANELFAKMACREMGYPGVLDTRSVNYSRQQTVLLDCDQNLVNSTQDCQISSGVARLMLVNCSSDVRLSTYKMLANTGLVELYYHDEWRFVCALGWSRQKSLMVCRALGYTFFQGEFSDHVFDHRQNRMRTWQSDGKCVTGTASLRTCLDTPLAPRACAVGNPLVGVICESEVRLVKITPSLLIVEIRRFNDWFRITALDWNSTAANIVCKQRGYPGAMRVDFYADDTKVARSIEKIHCNGHEKTLDSCHLQWGFGIAASQRFASLKCERDIRLIEGYGTAWPRVLTNKSSNMVEGTVQLFDREKKYWGLVADGNWSKADATVACRHLGFYTASRNFATEFKVKSSIVMEGPRCTGSEVFLYVCVGWRQPNTSDTDTIRRTVGGVTCVQPGDAICRTCECVESTVDCSDRKLNHLPWINDDFNPNLLEKYILRKNSIKIIRKQNFPFASLEDLDLSQNKIRDLPKDVFQYVRKMEKLNISGNRIPQLTGDIFTNLTKLRSLDISENNANTTDMAFLTALPKLDYLRADNFVECCYARDVLPHITCISTESAFSDCKALLREPAVRYVIWVMIVFTLVGNISVFVSRFFVKDGNISQKLFINSLGISDLLMGVYLTIIASKDQMLRGDYYKHERAWRQSTGCMVAHLLSMISSQASLMTLVAITYDRFRSITNIAQQRKIGGRRALAIVVAIWLVSGGLAALSLYNPAASIGDDDDEDGGIAGREYSKNAVCLPLVLRGRETPGWELSFLLYGIVNLGLSCYLLIAYIWMFVVIHKTSMRVQSTRIKTESALAKRMLCIVVSDLVCWLPVIICVFLAVFGLLPEDLARGKIFAFLAVCAIPINSALNPLLYTMSTPAVTNMVKKLRGKKEQNGG